ncbi:MAG TPA: tRNA lysidine(34) synthetase TilS [Solirubrobacteraceae bacterium]|nr:tRNA lysidine(34) synthetase TilS [Solirubrobacteraceae bacterium]
MAVDPAELQQRVRAEGLLEGDAPVVAMVSGGRDSVCLLDVAAALCGAGRVHALHVNYGLRGADSVADQRHTAELCAALGVGLELVNVGARARARALASGNLQAWARDLRYEAADGLADRLDGADERRVNRPEGQRGLDRRPPALIATGHTASDQLETILYRLAASPGRRALLGMAPKDGRIVRPLLWVTREQTAAYCRARGLPWREDRSNDDERYARARVRRRVVPALLSVHPAAQGSVLRTAAQLREESSLLSELVDRELGGADAIAVQRLADLHPALARLVVVRLAERAAGEPVPQAGERVPEILALAGRSSLGRGGRAELHVGGNVSATLAGGELTMVRLPPR